MRKDAAKLQIDRQFRRRSMPHQIRPHDLVKDAVATLNEEQRVVVKDYLDELMSGKYSEEQLWYIWEDAGARIRITTGVQGDSARFLRMIKAEIDSSK